MQPVELPERFPSPFDQLGPAPCARLAALALRAELEEGGGPLGPALSTLETAAGGKMFGVLVVRGPEGRVGCLRAFSGMLDGSWDHEGFVPPVFDTSRREQWEVPGEAKVKALIARAQALAASPELAQLRLAQKALRTRHEQERARLREVHRARRADRQQGRARLVTDPDLTEAARVASLDALAQHSRGDKAERRRLDERQRDEEREQGGGRARLERRCRALERLRRIVCRALMQRIHDTYRVPNARGEVRALRELYPDGAPPSGAGDCAAPKLLAYAYRAGLRPLALAEFWWGTPPPAGGRVRGGFYPSCREKCGPLVPFMLQGLEVVIPRVFVPGPSPGEGLRLVYQDEAVVVLDKPEGLLSVPGRGEALSDSILTRLRARFPGACGPLIVHRLDLDTSGLMVAALNLPAYLSLQRQFLKGEVQKRYLAWLDGEVKEEAGTICLPLRVDLHDRPRQICDPVHGKRALTRWEVLERRGSRTRVAFFPLTGRTHQLRVHAAHPLGLGAPIVGDRLYGNEEERLHLHAQALSFTHPVTGEVLRFESPAPFDG